MTDTQGLRPQAIGSFGPRMTAGSALMALNIFAALAIFWYGFLSLIEAWQTPEYSHGPVIPLLSAFMFLREMKSVPPADGPIRDRWPGVIVVVVALTIGLLGLAVRIPDIVTYALILWIGGTVLITFGARRGWYFWPSVLHLVFMLPLPMFIYWPVTIWLQTISSQVGVGLVGMAGIPVYLDGNVIDLGIYKLQVAEACSGLRYLFPVMSFSYVFSVLYTGPTWHKIVLLLSAAPITVLMNSFRIGVIGILVDNFGISQAEGFLHAFEGWVIFVACIALLFSLAVVMQRLGPNPRPLGESIDLNFEGLGTQIARFGKIVPSTSLIVASTLVTAIAFGWYFAPERQIAAVEREPLVFFPRRLGEWQSTTRLLEPEIEQVLGADDYLAASFRSSNSPAAIDIFIAYYDKQTEGSGIHSPEVCIPAGGWEISEWKTLVVDEPGAPAIELNWAIIQKGLAQQIVYYWFEQRGRRMASDYAAKAYTVWDSLLTGRSDGALVRMITPILPRETVDQAELRLRKMLPPLMERLPRYVPD